MSEPTFSEIADRLEDARDGIDEVVAKWNTVMASFICVHCHEPLGPTGDFLVHTFEGSKDGIMLHPACAVQSRRWYGGKVSGYADLRRHRKLREERRRRMQ